ncbi:MAG: PDZ domain-containing protein [Deltaproteobacteria bacterium]|nr:PDZ domain-containing protein [Deltaproteobacteria bacterium]
MALQVPDVQHGTVGVELETSDDGPVVAGLAMGSPADRAGMRKGDLILAVDGNNVQDLGTDELFGLLAGPLDTPIGIAVWDLEGSFTLHVTPEIMGHEEADRPTCLRL